MVALLASGLGDAGHRVVLVAPSGPVPRPDVHPVRSLPWRPSIALRVAVPGPGEVTRLLRREGVEVVHTHTEGPLGWAARAAAARLGLPAVHTLHTLYGHYLHYVAPTPGTRRAAARALDAGLARFLRTFDLALTPSARGRREVARLAPHLPVEVVPNGVAGGARPATATRAAALRARLGLRADDRLLVAVGRIAPEKRSEELLAALLPVVAARPDLRVVLAGGGPSLRRLRHRVACHELADRVRLPGAVPHPDVLALLHLADVVVSAARSENHPVSLLEAAAAGVPAVVRQDGGLEAVVTPTTGVLAPDDAALVRAAVALAHDRPRRARLGAAAQAAVAARSDTAHVTATRACYAQLTGTTRRLTTVTPDGSGPAPPPPPAATLSGQPR
jgi:1,2-diacylglycerol 3-alpha-glucosyltransferase